MRGSTIQRRAAGPRRPAAPADQCFSVCLAAPPANSPYRPLVPAAPTRPTALGLGLFVEFVVVEVVVVEVVVFILVVVELVLLVVEAVVKLEFVVVEFVVVLELALVALRLEAVGVRHRYPQGLATC